MAWNVVIAGGGFGGAMAARELERIMPRQSTRLVLVNDANFMLYTPFLPEAAAGTLEPRHVVTPLREILKRTYLRLGSIAGHDPVAKTVELRTREGDAEQLPYDQLLLALGSVSRVLPVPGLSEHAIGFKSLADAIWLRNHVIETLEAANATEDAARRDELLTYVFVGGGYAGLEALAELQDFAADAIESYPRARLHGMRWVLVEASDRVLPEIDSELADYALRELRGRGIDVRLGTTLEEVRADSARIATGETLPTRTVVWTAGVAPHPSLRQLSLPLDERGRVPVDEHLRVKGLDSVWAIGDCAAAPDPRGGLCPPTAQHAVRQGPVAARNIAAELGIGNASPFTYKGNAAFVNLGRYKAVGKVGGRTFRGFPAWWMARTYHMSQIPGAARKARAVIDWTASLPFRRDISEVGSIGHPKALEATIGPWDSSTSSSPSSSD
ncbi:MAG TPA: NAD(P)/FAD-dependent oxidoreductase [Solirubrobacterales bacterium]|jgi:NADH dehydrogenase|nr:NAD(P)/FAD-dependent oxidoreductase [Solirubrobacterales bacterium]